MYYPKQDLIDRIVAENERLRPIMVVHADCASGRKPGKIKDAYDLLIKDLLKVLEEAPDMLDVQSLLPVQKVIDRRLRPFLREVQIKGKKVANKEWIDVYVDQAVANLRQNTCRRIFELQGYSSIEVDGFNAELMNSANVYITQLFDLVWSELESRGYVEKGVLYMSADNFQRIVNALTTIRAEILEYFSGHNQQYRGRVGKTLLEMIQEDGIQDRIKAYVQRTFHPISEFIGLKTSELPRFEVVYGIDIENVDFISNLRNKFIGKERVGEDFPWTPFELEELEVDFGLRDDMTRVEADAVINSYLDDMDHLNELASRFNDEYHMGMQVRTGLCIAVKVEEIIHEDIARQEALKEAKKIMIPGLDIPEEGLPFVELIESTPDDDADVDEDDTEDDTEDDELPVGFEIDFSIPYDPENDYRVYTDGKVTLDEFLDPNFQIGLAIEWYKGANLDFNEFEIGTVEREIHELYLSFVDCAYDLEEQTSEQLSGLFLRVIKPNIENGIITKIRFELGLLS